MIDWLCPVQVLVKMNVKVECLYFTEEEEARVGPQDMIHYVVFERDTNDILSNFRILDKVRGFNQERRASLVIKIVILRCIFLILSPLISFKTRNLLNLWPLFVSVICFTSYSLYLTLWNSTGAGSWHRVLQTSQDGRGELEEDKPQIRRHAVTSKLRGMLP